MQHNPAGRHHPKTPILYLTLKACSHPRGDVLCFPKITIFPETRFYAYNLPQFRKSPKSYIYTQNQFNHNESHFSTNRIHPPFHSVTPIDFSFPLKIPITNPFHHPHPSPFTRNMLDFHPTSKHPTRISHQ